MIQIPICRDTTLEETVERFPETMSIFRLLEICCINDRNRDMTIEEFCLSCNIEPDSFLEAFNKKI